jgi:hypothetical protein
LWKKYYLAELATLEAEQISHLLSDVARLAREDLTIIPGIVYARAAP